MLAQPHFLKIIATLPGDRYVAGHNHDLSCHVPVPWQGGLFVGCDFFDSIDDFLILFLCLVVHPESGD